MPKAVRKALRLKDYSLPQHANVREDIIDIQDPETPGKLQRRKQGRRADNVFESLWQSGTLSGEERNAAGELAEIYARAHGVFGVGERRLERVQCESSDGMRAMQIRSRYGIQFYAILGRLEQGHAELLKALIHDFVLGDGAAMTEDGVRWREVVKRVRGKRRTGDVARAVKAAVEGLPEVIEVWRRGR
jgi:hypothetical protein